MQQVLASSDSLTNMEGEQQTKRRGGWGGDKDFSVYCSFMMYKGTSLLPKELSFQLVFSLEVLDLFLSL